MRESHPARALAARVGVLAAQQQLNELDGAGGGGDGLLPHEHAPPLVHIPADAAAAEPGGLGQRLRRAAGGPVGFEADAVVDGREGRGVGQDASKEEADAGSDAGRATAREACIVSRDGAHPVGMLLHGAADSMSGASVLEWRTLTH